MSPSDLRFAELGTWLGTWFWAARLYAASQPLGPERTNGHTVFGLQLVSRGQAAQVSREGLA